MPTPCWTGGAPWWPDQRTFVKLLSKSYLIFFIWEWLLPASKITKYSKLPDCYYVRKTHVCIHIFLPAIYHWTLFVFSRVPERHTDGSFLRSRPSQYGIYHFPRLTGTLCRQVSRHWLLSVVQRTTGWELRVKWRLHRRQLLGGTTLTDHAGHAGSITLLLTPGISSRESIQRQCPPP